MIVKVKPPSKV